MLWIWKGVIGGGRENSIEIESVAFQILSILGGGGDFVKGMEERKSENRRTIRMKSILILGFLTEDNKVSV